MTQHAQQVNSITGSIPASDGSVWVMPDSTDAAEDELIAVDDPTAKTLKRIASIGNIDGGSASSTYLASQIIDGGDEA